MVRLNILIFLKVRSLSNFFSLKQLILYFLMLWLFVSHFFFQFSISAANLSTCNNYTKYRFFKKNYYFTSVLKSPMAHRQWSQEQYVVTVRVLSIMLNFKKLLDRYYYFILNLSTLNSIRRLTLATEYLATLLISSFFVIKVFTFQSKFTFLLNM